MPIYNVHLYREMRLEYLDIEADSPEAAAKIADHLTTDPAMIEDCDGMTFSALVDLHGDVEYLHSKTIDFYKPDPAFIAAAQRVIDNWSSGDLAGAVRELDAALETAHRQQ
jgi:hypothetical protein